MKKVILTVSFIMLVLSIFVYIKCFNGESKEDLLAKYHITNVNVGNYSIDVVKQKVSLPVKDGLIKYYDVDLKRLEEYLAIVSNVKKDIRYDVCSDGHPLSPMGIKYDDGSQYSITVWCDGGYTIIDNYSYDDIAKKFREIFDISSERIEVTGTKKELINKYGIAGVRLETKEFRGFQVAGGKFYVTNDTTIVVGEHKVYHTEKVDENSKINKEKLNSFLKIIKNIKESIGKVSYDFEGSYFVITYVDGHQIEIIDNKNDEKLIDNYTFDDLNSMFMDILK